VLHRSAIRLEMPRLPLRSPAGCPAAQRRDGHRLPQCDRRRGTRHAPRRGLGPAPRRCGPPAVGGAPSKGERGWWKGEVATGRSPLHVRGRIGAAVACALCALNWWSACLCLRVGWKTLGAKKFVWKIFVQGILQHIFHFINIFTKYFFHVDFHFFCVLRRNLGRICENL